MMRPARDLVLLAFFASLCVFLCCPNSAVRSQTVSGIVNIYAPVSYIDTCENSVIVNPATLFHVGDRVLLIQMQGATTDESNTASYGSIQKYGDAGHYEFANIATINGLTV